MNTCTLIANCHSPCGILSENLINVKKFVNILIYHFFLTYKLKRKEKSEKKVIEKNERKRHIKS